MPERSQGRAIQGVDTVRRPSRRVLPTVIGTSLAATLAVDAGVALARAPGHAPEQTVADQFVAAAQRENLSPTAVAPLKERLSAVLLVAAAQTLPPAVVDRVRHLKGVKGVEV